MVKTMPQSTLHTRVMLEQAQRWFTSPLGQELLEIEQRLLDQILPSCHGDLLVEISPFSTQFDYERCPITQQCRLSPLLHPHCPPPALVAEPTALPLYPESASVVLLHHLLEFCADPHRTVREAVQTLAPEGRILIIGFNPRSLWGLWQRIAAHRGSGPWSGHFLTASRMEDWLSLLRCQPEGALYDRFGLPLQPRAWSRHWRGMSQIARQHHWPIGAIYLLVARKKRAALIAQPIARRRLRLAAVGTPKLVMGQVSKSESHE
ncbi:MAG: methyltransferase domain-containing protein [Pseudomonadales bacterium]|nr:methyltransferase domain-containing protein [Pseudomonadales bacterium]